MVAAGSPTFKVELDDGSGAFATDISAYVDRKSAISIVRGRQDEFSQIDAGTCSLTLNNTAGLFTLGLTAGIVVGRPIRVSVRKSGGTYVKRFTGNVGTWPVEWPGGKTRSKATISAADRFARLSRRTLIGSATATEVMASAPTYYWPLNDPAGSTAAAEQSGNGNGIPLPMVGTGAVIGFGSTLPPGSEGRTAATFTPGGRYLSIATSFTGTIGFVFSFATTGVSQSLFSAVVDNMLLSPQIDGSGVLSVTGTLSPTAVNDGLTHTVGFRYTATNTFDLYLDGAVIGTGLSGTLPIGGFPWPKFFSIGSPLGQMSDVAYWSSAPSAARFAAMTGAANGFTGDRSDQRIARLAGYANIATADQSLDTGAQIMGALADIDNTNVMDAMRLVEAAEQGLLFVNGTGQLVFQNRSHRYNSAAAVSISASAIDPGARFQGDDQGLINQSTVTRDGGSPQVYMDATSISAYELYPEDMTLAVTTDDEAFEIAAWRVNAHSQPAARLSSAKVDLLTNSTTVADAMLDLEISDVITISALPSQAPASSVSLFVEGWTETISNDEWSMDLNTTPTDKWNVWTVEDPVYGAPDQYPIAL